MTAENIILDKKRGVELTPHIVTNEKKLTFLIVPGGAYRSCDPKEGDPVVKNSTNSDIMPLFFVIPSARITNGHIRSRILTRQCVI